MKTPLILLLTTSLAANVALALRVAGTAEEPQGAVAEFVEPALPDPALPEPAISDVLAEKSARLFALEQRHLADARQAAAQYWLGDGDSRALEPSALAAAHGAMRAELVRAYGPAAEQDPVFAALFRPLDPVYDFLSSAEQLAVQELRAARDRTLQQALRAGAGGSAGQGVPPQVVQAADAAYRGALSELLGAELLFEFELRDSALSRQLRASGVGFTEPEFRQAFAVLHAVQTDGGGIAAMRAAREQLRELLGGSRFAQLRAARDPVFARLKDTAGRLGIPDASLQSVYEVLSQFQDRRLEAASLAGADSAAAAAESAALRDAERQALAGIVGAEHADEILRANAIGALQVFGGSRSSGSR